MSVLSIFENTKGKNAKRYIDLSSDCHNPDCGSPLYPDRVAPRSNHFPRNRMPHSSGYVVANAKAQILLRR